MTNEECYEDEFIIKLTIDGTDVKEEEVLVTDPYKPIRQQIDSIVSVFNLPDTDCGGNPVQYLLGKLISGEDDVEILELEDEYGREQTLLDFDIQPGDYLDLTSIPIAGYACPIPLEMQYEWEHFCRILK